MEIATVVSVTARCSRKHGNQRACRDFGLASRLGGAVLPGFAMTRKHSKVTTPEAHPRPGERSLFFAVDALRVPAGARADFEQWGCGLRAIVEGLLKRRPDVLAGALADPGMPRLTLAAIAGDLRHLAAFAAEVVAPRSSGDDLVRRVEHARWRLLELAGEVEAAGSGAAAFEQEMVDVGL